MSTNKQSFWSRPRGALLLGVAACAACCAPPIAALVIGAGAASTLAAIAEPLAGILMGAGALLGITLYVRHRRARTTAAACATDGSCGCGPTATKRTLYSSPDPVAEAPIACTVDLSNRSAVQEGIDAYRSAFDHHVRTDRTSTGFRWHFRSAPGLEQKLASLAAAEHGCCSFMKFEITTSNNEVIWEGRADAHAQTFIEEFMRLPERLREESRRGHDVAHLKKAAKGAGLVFTSDSPR